MQIAILEWELFGIEPEPNTAAWFAINLKQAFGQPGPRVEAAGVITFPKGMSLREVEEFAAAHARVAASSRPIVRADGSVEIVYQDPSARHVKEAT
jgi:hypothetical protein